jgi:hypothetical protein
MINFVFMKVRIYTNYISQFVMRVINGELIQVLIITYTEGRRPLGRRRRRWEDDIKMDLQQVEWGARSGFRWLRIGTGGGLL